MRKEAVQATVYVELFSQALRVLIPFMEQVGIGWKEIDQYDNFDHIADAAVYISDQNMVSIPLSDAFFSLVCEVD